MQELSSYCKEGIFIPDSVTVKLEGGCVLVTGALGTVKHVLHKSLLVKLNNKSNVFVYTKTGVVNTKNKALIGTTRALIKSMITGVTVGFIKKLLLVGIGYRVSIQDRVVHLMLGLSHSISYVLPTEITAVCPSQTEIVLTGIDKQLLGQSAADLRALKPPEPFKGKGIRYSDEVVCTKDSKKR